MIWMCIRVFGIDAIRFATMLMIFEYCRDALQALWSAGLASRRDSRLVYIIATSPRAVLACKYK